MMFNRFLRKKQTPSGGFDFLVVGLGNPGDRYEFTRHNAGFLTADRLADRTGCRLKKIRFHAVFGEANIAGRRGIIAKPQTYMNRSGDAVLELAEFYKIPYANIIILYDDITLPVGRLRIRKNGSDGGHNGMKSIVARLKTQDFPRVRIGIGERPHPDYDLADWVLSRFRPEEEKPLAAAIDNACDAVILMLEGNIDSAMNRYNGSN